MRACVCASVCLCMRVHVCRVNCVIKGLESQVSASWGKVLKNNGKF